MRVTYARTPLLMIVVLTLPLSCVRSRTLIPPRERIIEHGTPGESLNCPAATVVTRADTQMIGMNGGRLRSGNVEVRIPRRALQNERRFILRQDSGQAVGATIEVEQRVQFQDSSAHLTFDVSGCDRREIERQEWWVWRLNPVEGRSQKLGTTINPSRAMTAIDSTSVFLIAN